MAKKQRRGDRKPARSRREQGMQVTEDIAHFLSRARQKAAQEPVQALTEAQGHYILSIGSNPVTFGIGPAGTGKTYVAASLACEALQAKTIEKIYVARPMVDAEEHIGFLPGEVEDKFAPYFRPVRDTLEERLGAGFTEYLIQEKRIEICPFAFLRGRTLKNAFVILDEAQNTTPKQMQLFLTRLGENVTVVINGDLSQQDIPGPSGLADALRRFKNVPGFGVIGFDPEDVRRSALAQRVVEVYEAA